jgi:hypothetical protein
MTMNKSIRYITYKQEDRHLSLYTFAESAYETLGLAVYLFDTFSQNLVD